MRKIVKNEVLVWLVGSLLFRTGKKFLFSIKNLHHWTSIKKTCVLHKEFDKVTQIKLKVENLQTGKEIHTIIQYLFQARIC